MIVYPLLVSGICVNGSGMDGLSTPERALEGGDPKRSLTERWNEKLKDR